MTAWFRSFWTDDAGSFVENLVWITVAAMGTAAVSFGLVGAFRGKGADIVSDVAGMKTVGTVVTGGTTGNLEATVGDTGAAVTVQEH